MDSAFGTVRYPFDAWYYPRGFLDISSRYRLPWPSTCEDDRITIVISIPFAGAVIIATPLYAR